MNDTQLIIAAQRLAVKADCCGQIKLFQLPSGRNNRVYKLTSGSKDYLLKSYFRHSSDTRDRLDAEFSFVSFALTNHIYCVPEPIAKDAENSLVIYEFIQGRQLLVDELSGSHINQAWDFFLLLNEYRKVPGAQSLRNASEACFSLDEYFLNVESRIERLKQIAPVDAIAQRAKDFVFCKLVSEWEKVRKIAKQEAFFKGIDLDSQIPINSRCLSPSDFGFHNALMEENGTLRFIDFEYAGWDDPVKMVCDFFSQPNIPVPMFFFENCLKKLGNRFGNLSNLKERIRILFPVIRLKWCCIMLNEFLPVGKERREYALINMDNRKDQLDIVKTYIERSRL